MASLTGQKIKDTYDGLLKTSDSTQGLPDGTRTVIQDGLGNDSSLSIGKANNGATITGTLNANVNGSLIGNVTGNVTGNLTGDVDAEVVEVSNRIDANQVRVEGDKRPLVLTKATTTDAHIGMVTTGESDGFIASKNNHIGIGGTNGYSTNNLNIKKADGYVGIKQKVPLAPLHVKRNGEAIRLESTGDNICSIDFRQGSIKRGHVEFDNSNDTIEIKTTNPTGVKSQIKFSTAVGVGVDAQEVMRIKGQQVVIGNPASVPSTRELYVSGGIEATSQLWVGDNAEINGRCHADSFKVEGLNTAPATATSAGKQGEIRYTADYIYVCVNENSWKRTALTSW